MTSDGANSQPGSDPAVAAFSRVRSAARKIMRSGHGRSTGKFPVSGWGSGSGPDARDPQPLGQSIAHWVGENGYQLNMAVGGITGRWREIVGLVVAEHVTVAAYKPADDDRGGTLVVEADSPAWAVEMRYLVPELLERIAKELGPGLVAKVDVRRPVGGKSTGRWKTRPGRRPPE
ncbi:MAG: DUF721 domain-containing protein [Candidatus Nanopelagicales bacterium]|nr:DUF721 domain-containing protein [Candidatus Nanopelagicales bacterium]